LQTELFLLTPPFTQLNTPYPATAYLKGFLNTKNISATQADLGIEVILKLFSKQGLLDLFQSLNQQPKTENCKRIYALQEDYIKTIDPIIGFLQGKNPTLALQICSNNFLPEAARFKQKEDLEYAFGEMGTQDKAKHLATLYLEDISDFIIECVDSNFGFSRYAERLGRSANSFDELYNALNEEYTYIDKLLIDILKIKMEGIQPKMVLISVPFPGNLYAAFRCAQFVKQQYPTIKISMGGGFPNTELRSLSDARVFEFFDYITLDDGELPVELLIQSLTVGEEFKRTLLLKNGKVAYINNTTRRDYKQSEVGTPDYSDLLLDSYISVIEIVNPMHKMWSDGRWNKLTMAHGCYWGKCTFCDISLDYIKIYEPVAAKLIVDRMEELVAKTGETGFHFVDEAAPPALMREVALEIIRRKIVVSWWTNIRFEKSFTKDLCYLLKLSGCIAVSGGLEVASDRLLQLIDKGVTVAQVAKVCDNFTQNNILVHAYLMFGYPTQTVQETVDSLEMVRQLFENGVLQSGFWHQFAMTAHSPVGMSPEKFGVRAIGLEDNLLPKGGVHGLFANNDLNYIDKTGIAHDKFSFGLKKSLYNFMHGICFEYDLQDWFDFKIPKTTISPKFILNILENVSDAEVKEQRKIIWTGKQPMQEQYTKSKRGTAWEMLGLNFEDKNLSFEINLNLSEGKWLVEVLENLSVKQSKIWTLFELKKDFEKQFEDFELFWQSKPITTLRKHGLLVL
jgi:hypothetical protein